MLKALLLILLTVSVIFQADSSNAAVSRTFSFQVSVTIPPHVMANGPSNSNQLIQNQSAIRDNKTVTLRSIVVP